MCGIAGQFHLETPKPVDARRIEAMCTVMAHRGPDGAGVWTAPGVGLGHRRLSIIDVAGSPQPMQSSDGGLTITYNGEVYNYRALRAELEAEGIAFRTHGDTEVILNGYRRWGAAVLDRLNGMFAFAIHDARANSLFLARDRLGVKPLHYAPLADGSIIFASELKGLLAHPALRRTLSPQAIDDYMTFGYVPDDACFIEGVHKLPAGCALTLRCGARLPAPARWWDVDFSQRTQRRPAQLREELGALLRAAVTSRMVADVPLGAFLSGGVDSSTVVALMAEAQRGGVTTCSIGFDTAALDETRYAAQIAERFKTNHRTRIVAADDYGLIDTLVAAFDEPFADASALPMYRVSELAREVVTVALSGDGADEAFAGYRRHRFHYAEEQARRLIPAAVRAPLLGKLGAIYPKADWAPRPLRAKATLLGLARDGAEAYARAVGIVPPETRAALYTDSFAASLHGHRGEDRYLAAMRAAPARDPLDRAQYADLKIYLPGDILTKVDRTSMAVSLEAREPLLDYKLIEFAATLPVGMRLRGVQGKWLLKKTMDPILPRDILYRPKMGFVTPISAWFRGPLADSAARVISQSTLSDAGLFRPDVLNAMAADHRAGRADHGRLLWQLVMLDKALARIFG